MTTPTPETSKASKPSAAPTVALQSMTPEELAFAEIIGRLVEQGGFRPQLGNVWSLLYLRKDPLSPQHIQSLLGLSAGNVNALLNELLTWGVVERVRQPNDRKHYYRVEPQIWKSISNVLKARELRIMEEALESLKSVETDMKKSDSLPNKDYKVDQTRHALETIQIIFSLGSLLVNTSPKALASAAKLIGQLKSK